MVVKIDTMTINDVTKQGSSTVYSTNVYLIIDRIASRTRHVVKQKLKEVAIESIQNNLLVFDPRPLPRRNNLLVIASMNF